MNLSSIGKKTFGLEEIEKLYKITEYSQLVEKVKVLIEEAKIIPIKISGGNGKSPTLYKRYRVVPKVKDNKEILDEIHYKLCSRFNIEYYKSHLDKYREHRSDILKLNNFIINNSRLLDNRISMNERAFQIWGREKFLQKEGGKTILKNLGISLESLNYYDTSEPLAYYSHNKYTPQNVLIIENKDTYYTMRNHMINGNNTILGEKIDTIIYGRGKNLKKAFNDFKISVEEHVANDTNKFLYFGDLDYEGIIIYEGFYESFSQEYSLKPFINGYKKMLDKVKSLRTDLPQTKDGQNRKIGSLFLNQFNILSENSTDNLVDYKKAMEDILKNDLYIPQEIINITDL
ncbi:hypothetical protein FDB23_13295 [Clostridium botulinum]|nr:hypothetical protein [Clostridium botulinum]